MLLNQTPCLSLCTSQSLYCISTEQWHPVRLSLFFRPCCPNSDSPHATLDLVKHDQDYFDLFRCCPEHPPKLSNCGIWKPMLESIYEDLSHNAWNKSNVSRKPVFGNSSYKRLIVCFVCQAKFCYMPSWMFTRDKEPGQTHFLNSKLSGHRNVPQAQTWNR